MKKKITRYRFLFGVVILLLGVVMTFFIQTKSYSGFLIGFGASYAAITIRGDD